jgi:flagellar basal-body rod protein FlgG
MSLRALGTGATGLEAASTGLAVVANNLANLQTPGFKNARAMFQDLVYARVGAGSVGSGTGIARVSPDVRSGNLEFTGRELDVAIDGPGFLTVLGDDGVTYYTRAGNLTRNAAGQLTLSNGLPIDPSLRLPADASSISIDPDGTVSALTSAGRQTFGRIEVSAFANPEGLAQAGNNLWTATGASGDPFVLPSATIRQGYLESSNANLVDEMTTLIRLQQAFQMNAQVIQAASERLQMLRTLTSPR